MKAIEVGPMPFDELPYVLGHMRQLLAQQPGNGESG